VANVTPNLSFAGHGRTWMQLDGTWAMLFSGSMTGVPRPSRIMLATSSDGLTWQVVNINVYEKGHDPTVIRLKDGRIAVIFAYLFESLQAGFSDDGLTWTEPETLTLLDENGITLTRIYGDVALMRLMDGSFRLMANDTDGIVSFAPQM